MTHYSKKKKLGVITVKYLCLLYYSEIHVLIFFTVNSPVEAYYSKKITCEIPTL